MTFDSRPGTASPGQLEPAIVPGGGGGGGPSFTINPNDIYISAGNHTLTLTGSGTSWNAGTTVFSVTGGATKISQSITGTAAATIVVTTGGSPTVVTVSDGLGTSQTFTVGTPSIAVSPSSINAGTSGNVITLTGTHTLWSTDVPTFTVTGGTGPAITGQSISGQLLATVTLSAGSTAGTLTIHDPNPPSSGATASVTVNPPVTTTKIVAIESPFYSSDPAPAGYQLYKWSGGSLVTDGSRVTTGILATAATNGYCANATATLDTDGGYRGLALWDTGGGSPVYGVIELNIPIKPTGGSTVGGAGSITVTIVDESGNVRASLTGLGAAWFDQNRPALFSSVRQTWSGLTTNGSGVLSLALTNTLLTTGQTGWLVITNSDGTTGQSPAEICFSGPVTLS